MCLLMRPGGVKMSLCFISYWTWTQQDQSRPKFLDWDLTFNGTRSRTNEVPAQLPVCSFLTEHVTVPAGWSWLSPFRGAFQLCCCCCCCSDALFVGAEARHSASPPVDSAISHVYSALVEIPHAPMELWLQRSCVCLCGLTRLRAAFLTPD